MDSDPISRTMKWSTFSFAYFFILFIYSCSGTPVNDLSRGLSEFANEFYLVSRARKTTEFKIPFKFNKKLTFFNKQFLKTIFSSNVPKRRPET